MEQENGWQKLFHHKWWCFRGHSTREDAIIHTTENFHFPRSTHLFLSEWGNSYLEIPCSSKLGSLQLKTHVQTQKPPHIFHICVICYIFFLNSVFLAPSVPFLPKINCRKSVKLLVFRIQCISNTACLQHID